MEYFPYPVKIVLYWSPVKVILGDIPLIMELEGFDDLENYSIHIRGKDHW